MRSLMRYQMKTFLKITKNRERNYKGFLVENFETKINTNINDYSIEDALKLLEIKIDNDSDYESVKNMINEKIDKYIEIFKEANNQGIVEFFIELRRSLLGIDNNESQENLSEAEKLFLQYENAEKIEQDKQQISSGMSLNANVKANDSTNINSNVRNPLNRKYISKLLNVDSRFRRNYNNTLSTDYKIDLPYPINNVVELRLSDLEFPTTYYPFNDDYENTYFWIKMRRFGTDELHYIYIKIPQGNYYHTDLLESLQRDLDNNSPYGNISIIKITFNLDYDNAGGIGVGDGLITFDVSGIYQSQFDFGSNFDAPMLPVDQYPTSQSFSSTDPDDLISLNLRIINWQL